MFWTRLASRAGQRDEFATADISDLRLLLASADPAAATFEADVTAQLSVIREQILADGPASRSGRTWWPARLQRRHRKVVITCIAVPALLAASAAGWALAASPAASRVTYTVVCYSLPHLPERGVLEAAAGGAATGSSPTAMCARQWAAGLFNRHDHAVPPLVACARPAYGEVAVFPDTTCAAVGLPPLPAGYRHAARRFFNFDNALTADLVGSRSRSRCVTEPAAAAIIRRAARKYGFSSWRITKPAQIEPQMCWQAFANPATHTIAVITQPGVYPRTNVPARIIGRVMAPLYSPARCRSGNTPESTSAVRAALRTALRAAGYGNWKVVVLGAPDSRSDPCYVSGGLSTLTRTVDINNAGS